jgi:transposase-like protein
LLALCSNACKGLKNAMNNEFPYAEKRECFRHLIQNYIKQFGGSEYMYPAARAYRREIFDHYFSSIQEIPKVGSWLNDHHDSLWYRSGFNTDIKCDYVTNNIAKVFQQLD